MKNIQILSILATALILGAGVLTVRAQRQITERDGSYEIPVAMGTVIVTPVTNNLFRVATLPKGSVPRPGTSQSAVLSSLPTEIVVTDKPEAVYLASPTTIVRIDKESGEVSFRDPAGKLILTEIEGLKNLLSQKEIKFKGDGTQAFYGGGERGHSLNLNGDSLTMYNRQNYGYTGGDPRISQMGISVPYIASDKGYGILFDDYNEAVLELGDTIVYRSETPKPLSYYFINGNGTLSGITEGYTQLTGRQPLPPFWSLGYITSKYGYHNQDEATGAIDSLKTRGYPVDGMVLDLYWYGVETDMGRLEWDKKQWPDHKKMLSDLKEKGVNTVLISQPYINKKGAIDNYNYLSERGMLVRDSLGRTHDVTTWVGDAGMFDVSNPQTREWLWNRLKGLTEEGVAGWWGDLGEPEVHPRSIIHANGETASQYHNVYGNEWSRLIYEGLRRDFPDMRPLLMMRGGTAGLQRYGVFPWTTDVSRSWGGLEPQVNLMLSSGLSGLGYMSSDLGGFAVDPEHPTDEELYVRWVQMGAFTPSMRTHAQTKPEPYHYPDSEEILKKFIRMRYEWLPYNYTLAYENATHGYPLARPLNFTGENPEAKYASVEDEYLWGNEVLIAPVIKAGATERDVVFPKGVWINYNNPSQKYTGDTEAVVAAPLEELPTFVKAGSFIPLYTRPIENVTQYDPRFLTVRYYPSESETSYTLFDDNRQSPTSIEDGKIQLTTFTGKETNGEISISLKTNGGSYEGMPNERMLTFEVINVSKPTSVQLSDGVIMEEASSPKMIRQYGWCFDEQNKTLLIKMTWNYNPVSVSIK